MAEASAEIVIAHEMRIAGDTPVRQDWLRMMAIAVHEARPRDAQVRVCTPTARLERAYDCLEFA